MQNATETKYVDVINFSSSNGQIINLDDILGGKTADVINSYVNNLIKSNDNYDKSVNINSDSEFYILDSKPVLVFDSYTLAQNQTDIVEMPVDLSNITSYKLSKSEYYVKDTFNIRMIPLRKTAEGLYYNVDWNGYDKSFKVSDSITTSSGFVSSNIYTNNSQKIRLESKPDLSNDSLYVPLSYFTDVLNLNYKIDNNGEITFYKIQL